MFGPQDPIPDRPDPGEAGASPARAASTEALEERVRHLETRLAIQEDIVAACLERGTARAIQSLGAVVEYLAARGLIQEEDLKAYITDKHRIVGLPTADGSFRPVLDIHQWLSWRKSGRVRTQGLRPASPFLAELLDPPCTPNAQVSDDPSRPSDAA